VAKKVRQVAQARPGKTGQAGSGGRPAAVGRAVVTWLRSLRGRTIALTAGSLAVVAAVVVVGTLFLRHDDRPPIPDTRARHYNDVDACLLTDAKGITAGTTAAEVWQGMQDASLKTHARVSYAPVIGEQSAANARPYLNGLLQRSCDVVLAVGRAETSAAAQTAPGYRKVGFVLVGSGGGEAAGDNVTRLDTGDKLRADVAGAVERAVDGRA
jgi:basic membrane lipoprotein Med (substrate-binding protein (PBP1-ABC) superfamily)